MESWASEVREQILRIQFAAQFRAYREEFPHADERLILLDGVPIGWVIVDRSGDELHGIDIAVLAEARRQAIGLRVIRALQGEAAAGQRPMLITVLRQNVRALALYDRLGFHAIRATEVHIVMEWRGDPQQP